MTPFRVRVDPSRPIGAIAPEVYGGFIEHVGRCIYGGIYDEASPLSDDRGFRTDVLGALRALRLAVLRWPGGNFASGYHWEDGVGPKDRRPRRHDLAWDAVETNRFGTLEFIEYCRALAVTPYICVNMGTGSAEEAAAWVEYCNSTRETERVRQRGAEGGAASGVPWWGLGNELYGAHQIGTLTADQYVAKAREFAKLMRREDPAVRLVSCGLSGWSEWDRIVIDGLADVVDLHAVHAYTGSADHEENLRQARRADFALATCRALIRQARDSRDDARLGGVAFDEWNVWYRAAPPDHDERYNLSDALATATYLSCFVRHADVCRLAAVAQLVNVLAPVLATPDGIELQPTYHALRLYATHLTGTSIEAVSDAPDLDVVASVPQPGQVALAVINGEKERLGQLEVVGARAGTGTIHRLTGPDPQARGVEAGEEPLSGQLWLPGNSLSIITLEASLGASQRSA